MSGPPDTPYSQRLAVALERAGITRRGLARLLAEHEGGQVETKRRNVYKWLEGESEPEPLRAGLLAILLNDPFLAIISPAGRSSRLEQLVAVIAGIAEGQAEILDQLEETRELRETLESAVAESHRQLHEKLDRLLDAVEDGFRQGGAPPRQSGEQ